MLWGFQLKMTWVTVKSVIMHSVLVAFLLKGNCFYASGDVFMLLVCWFYTGKYLTIVYVIQYVVPTEIRS